MSDPLRNARHEAFALQIANGHKLERAHELAGFKPDRKTAWSLRHRPDVARRIEEILKQRIEADARRRTRREKKDEDLRDRVIEELKRIAFADVRDVVNWKREPVLSPDGELLDVVDRISVTASDRLSIDAAAAIKGVFHKSGQVRVEMHDKQSALVTLAKHLGLFEDSDRPNVMVNQVNIGDISAQDAAKRVQFMMRALLAKAETAPLVTIDAQPVQVSTDTDAPPTP